MDSVTLISWRSAAAVPHMALMIRRCLLSKCFLPALIGSRTHIIQRSTAVRSGVWSHLLSSIHVGGGFYFRSREMSSGLACLAPSPIPPSHAVDDFLRLGPGSPRVTVYVKVSPSKCWTFSEWGSRPICCTAVARDSEVRL